MTGLHGESVCRPLVRPGSGKNGLNRSLLRNLDLQSLQGQDPVLGFLQFAGHGQIHQRVIIGLRDLTTDPGREGSVFGYAVDGGLERIGSEQFRCQLGRMLTEPGVQNSSRRLKEIQPRQDSTRFRGGGNAGCQNGNIECSYDSRRDSRREAVR